MNTPNLSRSDAVVEKLLPCPFCGSVAAFKSIADDLEQSGDVYVECSNTAACGCVGTLGADEEEAAALWNRRAALPAAAPRETGNERVHGEQENEAYENMCLRCAIRFIGNKRQHTCHNCLYSRKVSVWIPTQPQVSAPPVQGDPVAWAVQLPDGTTSLLGSQGMDTFESAKKVCVLGEGCKYVFAYSAPQPLHAQGEQE